MKQLELSDKLADLPTTAYGNAVRAKVLRGNLEHRGAWRTMDADELLAEVKDECCDACGYYILLQLRPDIKLGFWARLTLRLWVTVSQWLWGQL